MIQMESVLKEIGNSGAKEVKCIKVLGGSGCMSADCGDVIVVSVTKVAKGVSNARVKKGDIHRAVIVKTKKGVRRPDGSTIKFGFNGVVLVDKQNELIGTRVFGIVPRELRYRGFTKIVSLAEGVI